MTYGIWNQTLIIQGNHSPQDSISLGNNVLKITVRAHPQSANNVHIGMNQKASESNILEPGDSVTYEDLRVYQDRNKLYIDFGTAGGNDGGKAIVEILVDTKDNCK